MPPKTEDDRLKEGSRRLILVYFRYLRSCTKVDSIDDERDFKEVMDAFKDLGISDDERDQTFELCAGILHLGCSLSSARRASISSLMLFFPQATVRSLPIQNRAMGVG